MFLYGKQFKGVNMSILQAVAQGADLKHANEKREVKNNFDANTICSA